MSAAKPLKLQGRDSEDLAIIASCLQESIGQLGNMVYQPRRRSFYCLLNRFAWERYDPEASEEVEQIGSLLYFRCVLAAHRRNLEAQSDDDALCLLTLYFHAEEPPSGMLRMLFAGDHEICLQVEAVEAYLLDVGAPWAGIAKPEEVMGLDKAWQS